MITLNHIHKYFDRLHAINDLSLEIEENSLYGILGINGAGKSTMLGMMVGILKPEQGEILIDGEPVFDNPNAKQNIFYLPDQPYFYSNMTLSSLKHFYADLYPTFDLKGFDYLTEKLNLQGIRKLRTFSKGMVRQAFLCAALCSQAEYLFCDEIFDGLDPIAARVMRSLIEEERSHRPLTIVIASHNLRDLEELCGHIAIIHQGGLLLSRDIHELSSDIIKFQCVFHKDEYDFLFSSLPLLDYKKTGMFVTMLVQGDETKLRSTINSRNPIYCGTIPLTLEELFISEMEKNGYDLTKTLF